MTSRLSRKIFLAIAAVAVGACGEALSQTTPGKPVGIIVSSPIDFSHQMIRIEPPKYLAGKTLAPFDGPPKGQWPPRFEVKTTVAGVGSLQPQTIASIQISGSSAPTPVPVQTQVPAPVVVQTPAPVQPQAPAPVVAQTPAPVQPQAPAPVVAQTPAPVQPQAPAPVVAQTPAPVQTQAPAPVVAHTPAPVQPQAPAPVVAQTPAPVQPQAPKYLVTGGSVCPLKIRYAQGNEHPLEPLIAWAEESVGVFQSRVTDYTYVMKKRERIGKKLSDQGVIFMKIREKPFSVYLRFIDPSPNAGQEALYVHGQNNNELFGHDVGLKKRLLGTLSLAPDSMIAMTGQRYPITDAGLSNLVRKILKTLQSELPYNEVKITIAAKGVSVEGKECVSVQIEHPVKRSYFKHAKSILCLYKDTGLPAQYESWNWPDKGNGPLILDEQYYFTKININPGLTDYDFNKDNKEYDF